MMSRRRKVLFIVGAIVLVGAVGFYGYRLTEFLLGYSTHYVPTYGKATTLKDVPGLRRALPHFDAMENIKYKCKARYRSDLMFWVGSMSRREFQEAVSQHDGLVVDRRSHASPQYVSPEVMEELDPGSLDSWTSENWQVFGQIDEGLHLTMYFDPKRGRLWGRILIDHSWGAPCLKMRMENYGQESKNKK